MSSKKLPKVLSREQVEELLKVPDVKRTVSGLRNRAILQVLYRAGLRVSEVCNLTPADVDLKQGVLYIQEGKGGKDRYVPIDSETIAWLKQWQEKRPAGDYFFSATRTGTAGNKLDVRYVRDMLYRISHRAGVYLQNGKNKKPVNPHAFRHTYATELLEEGFGIHEVQQLLGHSDIKTTSIYLSVRPVKLAEKIRGRGEAYCSP